MALELQGALSFIKFKNHIFEFQKNLKKSLDVGNDVYYNRAKSQCQILCILEHTKMKI